MFKDENQLDDFFGLKPENQEKITNNHNYPIKRRGLKELILFVPQLLSKRERYVVFVLGIVTVISLASIPFTIFFHFTKTAPDYGSSFVEGLVGEPRYINPLLSRTNDVDRDLTTLIYSGLMKYNEEGQLVPDLIKSYEISGDGLNYTVYLKDNARWHDNKSVAADDVIFTIQTAQNSDYGSAERFNWQGVEMEKIGDYSLIFKLKNKYAQFLNNFTIKILPMHLWQDVKPINFAFSELNLKPIGSGPYKFKKLKKDQDGKIISYELESNKSFYGGKPYISGITFLFYNSEDELINGYNKNDLDSLGSISSKNLKKIKFKQRINIQQLTIPRYFATFFNQNQSKILSNKNIRSALNYATSKDLLIKDTLDGNGTVINSPLSKTIFDDNNSSQKQFFDPEQAKKLLDSAGWNTVGDDGIRKNKDARLSLKLTTSSWPELVSVANNLKAQWAQLGIELNIGIVQTPDLQQIIKDRNYEILLFGEILSPDPDPFSLWHSSQKRDPGLNLALYDNAGVDKLLEDARQTLNPTDRLAKYAEFEKTLSQDVPAIFLYNPYYLYPQSKQIKGFDMKIIGTPSDRFANIGKWYINTKRVWK